MYMNVYIYIHIYVYIYIFTDVVYITIHMYINVGVWVRIFMLFLYIYTCLYICVYIFECIHAHKCNEPPPNTGRMLGSIHKLPLCMLTCVCLYMCARVHVSFYVITFITIDNVRNSLNALLAKIPFAFCFLTPPLKTMKSIPFSYPTGLWSPAYKFQKSSLSSGGLLWSGLNCIRVSG